jgi:hypothetical protein
MVKETQKAAVKKDGSTPKRKPGKPPRPGEVRTEKLVMRVHPDLMELLTESAREKGVTRSAYVEQLLVGWVRLDPRNRRVDMIGKYAPDAPDQKKVSPFAFYERWRRFAEASRLLLGAAPPADWYPPEMDIPDPDDPALPPLQRRR